MSWKRKEMGVELVLKNLQNVPGTTTFLHSVILIPSRNAKQVLMILMALGMVKGG